MMHINGCHLYPCLDLFLLDSVVEEVKVDSLRETPSWAEGKWEAVLLVAMIVCMYHVWLWSSTFTQRKVDVIFSFLRSLFSCKALL